jgi:hypothetical protein
MALFGNDPGPDPVVEALKLTIAALESERDYLRSQVRDLQGQILAITDARAHALLNRPQPVPRPAQEPKKPADNVFKMPQPMADIEAAFAHGAALEGRAVSAE